jgi:hypothetical protein
MKREIVYKHVDDIYRCDLLMCHYDCNDNDLAFYLCQDLLKTHIEIYGVFNNEEMTLVFLEYFVIALNKWPLLKLLSERGQLKTENGKLKVYGRLYKKLNLLTIQNLNTKKHPVYITGVFYLRRETEENRNAVFYLEIDERYCSL